MLISYDKMAYIVALSTDLSIKITIQKGEDLYVFL